MDHVALFPIYYRAIGYARSRSKAGNRYVCTALPICGYLLSAKQASWKYVYYVVRDNYSVVAYASSQGSKETLKQKWLVEKPGKPEHIVEHRAVYIALRRIVSTVPSWPTFKKLVCTDHFGTGKLN